MELYQCSAVICIIEAVGVATEAVHMSVGCGDAARGHCNCHLMKRFREEGPKVPVGVCRAHSGTRITLYRMVQVGELQRITGYRLLANYLNTRELGLTEHRSKKIYEVLQTLTLEDVKETQKKWVEGRTYHYCILGDIKDLDTKYLRTLGPVKTLTLEEIFGY